MAYHLKDINHLLSTYCNKSGIYGHLDNDETCLKYQGCTEQQICDFFKCFMDFDVDNCVKGTVKLQDLTIQTEKTNIMRNDSKKKLRVYTKQQLIELNDNCSDYSKLKNTIDIKFIFQDVQDVIFKIPALEITKKTQNESDCIQIFTTHQEIMISFENKQEECQNKQEFYCTFVEIFDLEMLLDFYYKLSINFYIQNEEENTENLVDDNQNHIADFNIKMYNSNNEFKQGSRLRRISDDNMNLFHNFVITINFTQCLVFYNIHSQMNKQSQNSSQNDFSRKNDKERSLSDFAGEKEEWNFVNSKISNSYIPGIKGVHALFGFSAELTNSKKNKSEFKKLESGLILNDYNGYKDSFLPYFSCNNNSFSNIKNVLYRKLMNYDYWTQEGMIADSKVKTTLGTAANEDYGKDFPSEKMQSQSKFKGIKISKSKKHLLPNQNTANSFKIQSNSSNIDFNKIIMFIFPEIDYSFIINILQPMFDTKISKEIGASLNISTFKAYLIKESNFRNYITVFHLDNKSKKETLLNQNSNTCFIENPNYKKLIDQSNKINLTNLKTFIMKTNEMMFQFEQGDIKFPSEKIIFRIFSEEIKTDQSKVIFPCIYTNGILASKDRIFEQNNPFYESETFNKIEIKTMYPDINFKMEDYNEIKNNSIDPSFSKEMSDKGMKSQFFSEKEKSENNQSEIWSIKDDFDNKSNLAGLGKKKLHFSFPFVRFENYYDQEELSETSSYMNKLMNVTKNLTRCIESFTSTNYAYENMVYCKYLYIDLIKMSQNEKKDPEKIIKNQNEYQFQDHKKQNIEQLEADLDDTLKQSSKLNITTNKKQDIEQLETNLDDTLRHSSKLNISGNKIKIPSDSPKKKSGSNEIKKRPRVPKPSKNPNQPSSKSKTNTIDYTFTLRYQLNNALISNKETRIFSVKIFDLQKFIQKDHITYTIHKPESETLDAFLNESNNSFVNQTYTKTKKIDNMYKRFLELKDFPYKFEVYNGDSLTDEICLVGSIGDKSDDQDLEIFKLLKLREDSTNAQQKYQKSNQTVFGYFWNDFDDIFKKDYNLNDFSIRTDFGGEMNSIILENVYAKFYLDADDMKKNSDKSVSAENNYDDFFVEYLENLFECNITKSNPNFARTDNQFNELIRINNIKMNELVFEYQFRKKNLENETTSQNLDTYTFLSYINKLNISIDTKGKNPVDGNPKRKISDNNNKLKPQTICQVDRIQYMVIDITKYQENNNSPPINFFMLSKINFQNLEFYFEKLGFVNVQELYGMELKSKFNKNLSINISKACLKGSKDNIEAYQSYFLNNIIYSFLINLKFILTKKDISRKVSTDSLMNNSDLFEEKNNSVDKEDIVDILNDQNNVESNEDNSLKKILDKQMQLMKLLTFTDSEYNPLNVNENLLNTENIKISIDQVVIDIYLDEDFCYKDQKKVPIEIFVSQPIFESEVGNQDDKIKKPPIKAKTSDIKTKEPSNEIGFKKSIKASNASFIQESIIKELMNKNTDFDDTFTVDNTFLGFRKYDIEETNSIFIDGISMIKDDKNKPFIKKKEFSNRGSRSNTPEKSFFLLEKDNNQKYILAKEDDPGEKNNNSFQQTGIKKVDNLTININKHVLKDKAEYKNQLDHKLIFNKRKKDHSIKFCLGKLKIFLSYDESILINFLLKIHKLRIYTFSDQRTTKEQLILSKQVKEINCDYSVIFEYTSSLFTNAKIYKLAFGDLKIDIDVHSMFVIEELMKYKNRHFNLKPENFIENNNKNGDSKQDLKLFLMNNFSLDVNLEFTDGSCVKNQELIVPMIFVENKKVDSMKEFFINFIQPPISTLNNNFYKSIEQSRIKKKYPILGNLWSLGQNLKGIEWKILRVNNIERYKLAKSLKAEFIDINGVIYDLSVSSYQKLINVSTIFM